MIIEEEDFRLESCGDSNCRFDLEIIKTIKPKGGEPRQEMKIMGYGMSLLSCMKHIINSRIERKKDVLTLKEYLRFYKEETDKIESLFKNI